MRRYLVTSIAVLGLLGLVAGCTSGDDGETADVEAGETDGSAGGPGTTDAPDTTAGSGTTEETSPPPTGPAPGVTADSIKLGVTYVDLEAIREVSDIDHGDYEAAFTALIEDINARGGIHGRTIDPVFAAINPILTQPAEEACLRLTQDEEVFAAVGFFIDDTVLCYLETNETAVIGGRMTDERLARASAPWFTFETGSDLQLDSIRAFAEEGLLDGNFAVFGNILDESFLREQVEPLLDELGVEPSEVAVLDAPRDDVAAQNAATAVIAERFRSSGVETVIIVGTAPVSWANGVEPTDYRPRLLLLDRDTTMAVVNDQTERDLSILDDAVVGGVFGPPAASWDLPNMQECVAVLEAAGLSYPHPADWVDGEPELFVSAFSACRTMALFAAIAEAAGPDLNYGTFRQAGEQLGEMDMPGFPEPLVYGPPPSADGDPPIYMYEWDPAERDFVRRDG